MNRLVLPLVPASVFLFILPFTHTVALRLLGLFTAAALTIWYWVRSPRTSRAQLPRDLPAWRWIALWALLPLVLLGFSHDIRYSLGEIKTEVGYGLLALLVCFVLAHDSRAFRVMVYVLLASYVALLSWALGAWRYYGGEWFQPGYQGGIGTFATYLVTAMPLLVIVWRQRLLGRFSAGLVVALTAYGLLLGYLTSQRAIWIPLSTQLVVLILLLRREGVWRVSRGALVTFIGLVALVTVLAFIEADSRRFGTASPLTILGNDVRLKTWPMVAEWIAQEPITGHGFGRGMMERVHPALAQREDLFWHAHNVVLNYGFQLGVPGLIAILGVFGGLLRHWLKSTGSAHPGVRVVAQAGALVVVGVFVRNMTNDFFVRDLSLLFWGLSGTLAGYVAAHRHEPDASGGPVNQ